MSKKRERPAFGKLLPKTMEKVQSKRGVTLRANVRPPTLPKLNWQEKGNAPWSR